MTPWPAELTFDVAVVGRRLGLLLFVMAAYYLLAGLIVQWYGVRVDNWGSAGSLINALILSLLMGFRNRTAYARWWEARGHWGQLTNDSRNLSAKLAAFVPAEALASSRVADILLAFPGALKRHLRSESLELRDLAGFENSTDDPDHVPLYLSKRLYAIIAKWHRDGEFDQGVLRVLDEHARGYMNVCGACEKIRTTPLSPTYKGLLRTGLVLNVLVAPWVIVPESGLWSLPIVLLACFFFFGVELIDSIVEEPFGKERDDLDLDRYCRTIRESIIATLPIPVRAV